MSDSDARNDPPRDHSERHVQQGGDNSQFAGSHSQVAGANATMTQINTKAVYMPSQQGQGDNVRSDLGQAHIHAQVLHFGKGDVIFGKENSENEENVKERLCEELKKFLDNKAKEICGTKDRLLAERHVNIAPLEISTQNRDWKHIDESGHFHHREDILQVFAKAPTGDIAHSELFKKAMEQATLQAESAATNKEAKNKYIQTHGNIVGVTGHAGIGKTTLTKLLVDKVFSEDKYFDVDYIFYLRFRDINMGQNVNLLQFLTTNDPAIFSQESDQHKSVLLEALDQNNRVLIVMDGLDEAAVIRMDEHFVKKCSVHDTVNGETFTKNILNGNILRSAKKLITSRPRQMYELHEDYKPKFMVNVLGLNKDAQKQICGDIVCHKEELKDQILDFLKNHPDLSSYCYVPVNCILIMYCIYHNLKEISSDQMKAMDSLTTIMVAALGLFIKNGHLHCEEFQIKNLCDLAYKGFKENRLYFGKEELQNSHINKENANAFLTAGIGSDNELNLWDGIETKFYFSHLILQELCVAVYMKLYLGIKGFKDSISSLDSSRYQMVTKLLFGLCNKTTLSYLRKLHKKYNTKELILTDEDEKSSKQQLQNLVFKQLDQLSRGTTKKFVFNVFQICSWVYEMRDDTFTEKVVDKLQRKLVVTGEILPNDVPGFHYLLRFRKTPLILSIVAPSFVEEALERFFVEMDKTFNATKLKMTKLKFKSDNVGDDGAKWIATCLYNIDQLYLVACPLTEKGLESLSDAVLQKSSSLRRLDLCAITIDDKGAVQLQKCIGNIDRVKLQLCKLTDAGIQSLTEGIKMRNSTMAELNLSEGAIGDEGAAHLAACLPHIRELKLKFCNITAVGVESVTNAIVQNSLRLLDLSENIIGNDGAKHLAKCISHVDELILEYCYIDATGIAVLAEAIRQRSRNMEHLFILNNKIGDDGFESMSRCLEKINKLSIGDCNDIYLTFKGIRAFTMELRNQASTMAELSVCCRRCVEEKAKKELLQCKQKAKKFFFQNTPLVEN